MLKAIFYSGKVSSALLCANYREVTQKFELLCYIKILHIDVDCVKSKS